MRRRENPAPGGASDQVLPSDLARVLTWMRQRLDEPMHLETLAYVAGVRPRTLETHFQTFLGTTPLGWLRMMRLQAARQLLLESKEQSVTEIALASGFNQLGRFAARYHAMFGELPSQTLRRARMPDAALDDEALRLTWRALPAALQVAAHACDAALEDLERAQTIAPSYGLAKALAAWCWSQRAAQHFSATPEQDRACARELVEQAERLAPDDGMALTLCSGTLALLHSVDAADRLVERALAIDPYSPLAVSRRAWLSVYQGDSAAALRGFRRLMPFDALRHTAFIGMGCAHFAAGRYERAAVWAKSGVEVLPAAFWGERIVIAGAMHAGARAEARRRARALMRKDPELTVAIAGTAWPCRPSFMEQLTDGLAAAGVPRD
ncbi:helix-turn-helix domain-containing protein [Taklimakanibacter deserti]|uniref:helix-turn-helix domain-containing protein n=1 Tax=Taklimakanibacter deserti TaxID=2267839 RepID=UPI000E65A23C